MQTKIIPFPNPGRPGSPQVTAAMASAIKAMLRAGMMQHDIAAHFGINQGRVSEINTGLLFPNVE
jgi:hypothetical protein